MALITFMCAGSTLIEISVCKISGRIPLDHKSNRGANPAWLKIVGEDFSSERGTHHKGLARSRTHKDIIIYMKYYILYGC